jgi:hypothetical protein
MIFRVSLVLCKLSIGFLGRTLSNRVAWLSPEVAAEVGIRVVWRQFDVDTGAICVRSRLPPGRKSTDSLTREERVLRGFAWELSNWFPPAEIGVEEATL